MLFRSVDQNEAIKTIKHTITELDRSKIEEQKKAVRAGYDMDIIPSDLATYGKDAKALLKELQSLGLDVRVLRDNGEEVDMSENIDYSDTNYDLRSIIEGDRRYNDKEDLSDYGFQKQEFKGDELVNVEEDDYTNDGAKDDYVDDDYTEDDDK